MKGKKAAGILFTDGTKILLLKRSNEGDHGNTWSLPGGKGKDGETEIGNAIRETKEETGVKSIPGHRIDSLSNQNGRQKFTCFIYKVSEIFDVNLSNEHTDWEWVDIKSLGSKELHPKLKEEMPRYLRSIMRKIKKFSEWASFNATIHSLL